MDKKELLKIADKITPRERKELRYLKGLSVEELWILRKQKTLKSLVLLFLLFGFLLYEPFVFFISTIERTGVFFRGYFVFLFSLLNVSIFSFGLAIPIYLSIYFVDKFTDNYFKKAKNLIDKIKKQLKS